VRRVAAAFLALASLISCSQESESPPEQRADPNEIIVGSFNFTENQILAEIYASSLESHGYSVRRLHDVAAREIMEPAMEQAFVDFVVEYQGTALNFLRLTREPLGISSRTIYERLQEELATRGLVAFDFAPVESKNEVVVSTATAAEHDLVNISDLKPLAPDMVFGGPPECPSRPQCLVGLEAVYGLEFKSFLPLDTGGPVTAAALGSGEIDAGILFTTSPALVSGKLTVLVDDLGLQPPENIVPFARREVVSTHGADLVRLVNSISARLSTVALRTLNQRVDIGGEDPIEVARSWVREEGLDR
jgi:osmoprotectant transport system substrate-binding protein